jgi:hypothetical protein
VRTRYITPRVSTSRGAIGERERRILSFSLPFKLVSQERNTPRRAPRTGPRMKRASHAILLEASRVECPARPTAVAEEEGEEEVEA